MDTYTATLTFGTLKFEADLADASAPIYHLFEGESTITQYQTADARHDETEAAALVIQHLGPDYWLDPDDEYPDDPDSYILDLICSVE